MRAFLVARPRGFEPVTFGSVDRRSIQLSYGRMGVVQCRAERAGFEPAMGVEPHTRLAGECLQPLGHLSWKLLEASVNVPSGSVGPVQRYGARRRGGRAV